MSNDALTMIQIVSAAPFTNPGTATPVDCGSNGSVVTNAGSVTIYYNDELPVSQASTTLAAGASATLTGTYYFQMFATTSATQTTTLRVLREPDIQGEFLSASDVDRTGIADTYVPRYKASTAKIVFKEPRIIDVRDFGVVADGVTDDSAALQSAIDYAKKTTYSAGLGLGAATNDIFGSTVELPFGRIKLNTGVTIPANVWVRGKGPTSTYLYLNSSTAFALAAVSTASNVTISDLGIVQMASTPSAGGGISLPANSVGPNILGDSRHVVRDVIIVGTYDGIKGLGTNEARVHRVTVQRCLHRGIDADASTDWFISDCTVGQPGEIAFLLTGGNGRMWGCKAYGGSYASGSNTAHFSIAGSGRHEVTCCESQDGPGVGFTIGGNDLSTLTSCLVDSNFRWGFDIGFSSSNAHIMACSVAKRVGGAYTPQAALNAQSATGAVVDLTIKGAISALWSGGTGKGNRIVINQGGQGGFQDLAYAASITPDPFLGQTVNVGTLTGNLTVNAPSGTWSSAGYPPGQKVAFILTQDGTGGRTVTFNAVYKTTAAIDTTLSTVTRIEFEYDGTNWRETSRTKT